MLNLLALLSPQELEELCLAFREAVRVPTPVTSSSSSSDDGDQLEKSVSEQKEEEEKEEETSTISSRKNNNKKNSSENVSEEQKTKKKKKTHSFNNCVNILQFVTLTLPFVVSALTRNGFEPISDMTNRKLTKYERISKIANRELKELFRKIDSNSKKEISWGELLQYLSDEVDKRTTTTEQSGLSWSRAARHSSSVTASGGGDASSFEIASSGISTIYTVAHVTNTLDRRSSPVSQFVAEWNAYLCGVSEAGRQGFELIDADNFSTIRIGYYPEKLSSILHATAIPKHSLLACCHYDSTVTFWSLPNATVSQNSSSSQSTSSSQSLSIHNELTELYKERYDVNTGEALSSSVLHRDLHRQRQKYHHNEQNNDNNDTTPSSSPKNTSHYSPKNSNKSSHVSSSSSILCFKKLTPLDTHEHVRLFLCHSETSILYSGNASGKIQSWNLHSSSVNDRYLPSSTNFCQPHSSNVTCLCSCSNNRLVSVSVDKTLAVIDCETMKILEKRGGGRSSSRGIGHDSGILAACVVDDSDAIEVQVATGGFQDFILLWTLLSKNTHANNTSSSNIETSSSHHHHHSSSSSKLVLPHRLIDPSNPHRSAIEIISKVGKNSPYIASADQSGIIKIWDTRVLRCVQTIHVFRLGEDEAVAPQYVMSNTVAQRLLAARKQQVEISADHLTASVRRLFKGTSAPSGVSRHFTFAADNSSGLLCNGPRNTYLLRGFIPRFPTRCDDFSVIAAIQVTSVSTILTLHSDAVKSWQIVTGAMIAVHNIGRSSLTCIAVDQQSRVYYVGDAKGCISAHSCYSGTQQSAIWNVFPSGEAVKSLVSMRQHRDGGTHLLFAISNTCCCVTEEQQNSDSSNNNSSNSVVSGSRRVISLNHIARNISMLSQFLNLDFDSDEERIEKSQHGVFALSVDGRIDHIASKTYHHAKKRDNKNNNKNDKNKNPVIQKSFAYGKDEFRNVRNNNNNNVNNNNNNKNSNSNTGENFLTDFVPSEDVDFSQLVSYKEMSLVVFCANNIIIAIDTSSNSSHNFDLQHAFHVGRSRRVISCCDLATMSCIAVLDDHFFLSLFAVRPSALGNQLVAVRNLSRAHPSRSWLRSFATAKFHNNNNTINNNNSQNDTNNNNDTNAKVEDFFSSPTITTTTQAKEEGDDGQKQKPSFENHENDNNINKNENENKNCLEDLPEYEFATPSCLSFHSNSCILIVGDSDSGISSWNLRKLKREYLLRPIRYPPSGGKRNIRRFFHHYYNITVPSHTTLFVKNSNNKNNKNEEKQKNISDHDDENDQEEEEGEEPLISELEHFSNSLIEFEFRRGNDFSEFDEELFNEEQLRLKRMEQMSSNAMSYGVKSNTTTSNTSPNDNDNNKSNTENLNNATTTKLQKKTPSSPSSPFLTSVPSSFVTTNSISDFTNNVFFDKNKPQKRKKKQAIILPFPCNRGDEPLHRPTNSINNNNNNSSSSANRRRNHHHQHEEDQNMIIDSLSERNPNEGGIRAIIPLISIGNRIAYLSLGQNDCRVLLLARDFEMYGELQQQRTKENVNAPDLHFHSDTGMHESSIMGERSQQQQQQKSDDNEKEQKQHNSTLLEQSFILQQTKNKLTTSDSAWQYCDITEHENSFVDPYVDLSDGAIALLYRYIKDVRFKIEYKTSAYKSFHGLEDLREDYDEQQQQEDEEEQKKKKKSTILDFSSTLEKEEEEQQQQSSSSHKMPTIRCALALTRRFDAIHQRRKMENFSNEKIHQKIQHHQYSNDNSNKNSRPESKSSTTTSLTNTHSKYSFANVIVENEDEDDFNNNNKKGNLYSPIPKHHAELSHQTHQAKVRNNNNKDNNRENVIKSNNNISSSLLTPQKPQKQQQQRQESKTSSTSKTKKTKRQQKLEDFFSNFTIHSPNESDHHFHKHLRQHHHQVSSSSPGRKQIVDAVAQTARNSSTSLFPSPLLNSMQRQHQQQQQQQQQQQKQQDLHHISPPHHVPVVSSARLFSEVTKTISPQTKNVSSPSLYQTNNYSASKTKIQLSPMKNNKDDDDNEEAVTVTTPNRNNNNKNKLETSPPLPFFSHSIPSSPKKVQTTNDNNKNTNLETSKTTTSEVSIRRDTHRTNKYKLSERVGLSSEEVFKFKSDIARSEQQLLSIAHNKVRNCSNDGSILLDKNILKQPKMRL